MDRDVLSLQTRIHRVEDEIFADFCRLIRVSSIRDYEEQHSRVTEEATAKRLQFTSQISRLENQIAFQRQQRDQILKKVEQLVTQISGGEIDLQALRADRETTLASLASQRAEYKTFASEHQRMRLAIEQKHFFLKLQRSRRVLLSRRPSLKNPWIARSKYYCGARSRKSTSPYCEVLWTV